LVGYDPNLDPRRARWGKLREEIEKTKAGIRSKIEHPFHVVKNLFRHARRATAGWTRTRRSSF
jgi:IS5 family transposase